MRAAVRSDDSQAILLLCSTLALPRSESAPKPLSRLEWNDVARAIVSSGLARPGAILGFGPTQICNELNVPRSVAERMARLLERGGQLALELERLNGMGIWVLTRADDEYPVRLKDRLKASAPPVLFGAGTLGHVNAAGLAIVGSRDVDEGGAAFARELGARCATSRLVVLSGGARGVDRTAAEGAMAEGGRSVAVLADSLEHTLKGRDVRQAVLDSLLTLVTALHPSTRFSVAAAMGRNKVIYGLSTWAAVVSSGDRSGGTWAGATENLRARWVPLFVRDEPGAPAGNHELIKLGGIPFALAHLSSDLPAWLDAAADRQVPIVSDAVHVRETPESYGAGSTASTSVNTENVGPVTMTADSRADMFQHVWPLLAKYLTVARTRDEVAAGFGLEPTQAKVWLERAVREGRARRLKRPVRYETATDSTTTQKGLFG